MLCKTYLCWCVKEYIYYCCMLKSFEHRPNESPIDMEVITNICKKEQYSVNVFYDHKNNYGDI